MADTLAVFRSLSLFVVAGVCEIGGGWLVWKWLRDGRPAWWGLVGGLILILYGIIPTLQTANFGRVYAVYGGFFIVLSLLWGWSFDGNRPDRADVLGAGIALVGVCVMMYWPRAGWDSLRLTVRLSNGTIKLNNECLESGPLEPWSLDMNIQTASAALHPLIPPDVVAFAREQGVEKYLPELIEWAREVYPSATRFEVFTEDDPEIADDRHIIFELDVPLDVGQALEADRKWHRGVFQIVPAPLVCVFRLSADLR